MYNSKIIFIFALIKLNKYKLKNNIMELDKRMKVFYENITRSYLPRRTYTILRIDGKRFSKYTKGLERPFDKDFAYNMVETAQFLFENIQGCKFAYVQSDEISLLLTDFDNLESSPWFDGNIQKIVSISSSMTTAFFNSIRPGKLAFFDSRVFTIPSKIEVCNYFRWRWRDCVRNSIFKFAQTYFSPKELFKLKQKDVLNLLENNGYRWNELDKNLKDGTFIYKIKDENNKSITILNSEVDFDYLLNNIIPEN